MPALALIAGLIGFLAMPAILVGLIKPHWVMPAAWRPTRGRAALLYLALSIAGVGIAGSMTPPSPETLARQEADASRISDAARTVQEQANPTPVKPEASATPAPTEDQSQAKVTLYKTEEPSSVSNGAPVQRANEGLRAEAAQSVEKPKSFPIDRSTFVALARSWGWGCKAPIERKLGLRVAGAVKMTETEVVYCQNPGNIDTFMIYGSQSETYFLSYIGDLLHPNQDQPSVSEARFSEVMAILQADKIAKTVTAAIRKQRKLAQDAGCIAGQNCPTYRDERSEGGIDLEFIASVKRTVDWRLTPAQ